MIFELTQDFHDAVAAMPRGHPKHKILSLLEEAIRRDIHFIARHPTTLFQCMWNTCWWYDCPEAARYYETPKGGWQIGKETPPWIKPSSRLSHLMEDWLAAKEDTSPQFCWIRSNFPRKIYVTHENVRTPSILGLSKRSLHGHLRRIAFSPCGKWVVFGAADNTIQMWNLVEYERRRFIGHNAPVIGLEFSSEGKFMASCSTDLTIIIWEVATGRKVACYQEHSGHYLLGMSFSPNGRFMASSSNVGELRVWDAMTGKDVSWSSNEKPADWIEDVRWSPDGTWLGCVRDGRAYVWNFRTREAVLNLHLHAMRIRYSKDSSFIVIDTWGGSCVWDLNTGECVVERLRPLDDVCALVSGVPSFRFWLIEGKVETSIISTVTAETVAYVPLLLKDLFLSKETIRHPFDEKWACDIGNQLYMFSLEQAAQHVKSPQVGSSNSRRFCFQALKAIVELRPQADLKKENRQMKLKRKFCDACGGIIPQVFTGVVCSDCGKVAIDEDWLVITSKECSNCGVMIPVSSRYCGYCGVKCL